VLGWSGRCKLAHEFLWEYSHKRAEVGPTSGPTACVSHSRIASDRRKGAHRGRAGGRLRTVHCTAHHAAAPTPPPPLPPALQTALAEFSCARGLPDVAEHSCRLRWPSSATSVECMLPPSSHGLRCHCSSSMQRLASAADEQRYRCLSKNHTTTAVHKTS
jgi:hypothetical protein